MRKETVRSVNLNADTFSPTTADETFKIKKGPLNYGSKKVAYLSERKKCKNSYVRNSYKTLFRE